jgi:uncharacterized protein YebE (UPF0316 family)
METLLDPTTLATGVLVFLARVFDVTLGTLRTISTVQGRTRTAFALGFFEITMWLVVISTVISEVTSKPVLGFFYALGFSTGNVVGILVEQRLALGRAVVRVISTTHGREIANRIRELGHRVTSFAGEEPQGPVNLLFVVCLRKQVPVVVAALRAIEPEAFYTVDMLGPTGRATRPIMQPATGWRALIKRK